MLKKGLKLSKTPGDGWIQGREREDAVLVGDEQAFFAEALRGKIRGDWTYRTTKV